MNIRLLVRRSVVSVGFVAACASSAYAQQTGPADQFYAAIRNNDLAGLRGLIAGGADLNAHDRRGGATPLMHAAAIGSVDAMTLLLDKGADVNARSAARATALMWAVTSEAKVRLLLDRGADVNAVSEAGRTPLLLAAMSDRSAAIVRLLLQHGADAKARDSIGMTSLIAATVGNDIETIREIAALGIDVNAAPDGDTPESAGTTALMIAAGKGNTEAVRLLLSRGANVNAVSRPPAIEVKNGTIAIGRMTPLILAAATARADTIRVLLDAGADIDAREARGMTALMSAAASDHSDIQTVKLLLERGADVSIATPAGETAADWARKSGSTPVVALLRQHGAVITPLPAHTAAAPSTADPRQAVTRGVAVLDRMAGTFFSNGACGACHAQNATDMAVAAARRSGLAINEQALSMRLAGAAGQFGGIATRLLERFDGPVVDIPLYTLSGFAAAGYPADRATDALVFNVAAQQARDGSWHVGGVIRPPIEDGDFSRTALAIRALATYAMPGRADEMDTRVGKASAWLFAQKPRTTEDASFRLLGLKWAKASSAKVKLAAEDLLALHRPDGGWAQRPEMSSDAYATGLALYALLESGALNRSSEPVRRGRDYLLKEQRADGSWYVRSRAPKFQPYFDGGFPYEHDQWISAMATSWSTSALAMTLTGN
jgi:ankyrin repeat protein